MAMAKLPGGSSELFELAYLQLRFLWYEEHPRCGATRNVMSLQYITNQPKILIAAMQQDLIALLLSTLLLEIAAKTNSERLAAACAFCNTKIPFGESVCLDCMKKYNIKPFDLGTDGCGCDK